MGVGVGVEGITSVGETFGISILSGMPLGASPLATGSPSVAFSASLSSTPASATAVPFFFFPRFLRRPFRLPGTAGASISLSDSSPSATSSMGSAEPLDAVAGSGFGWSKSGANMTFLAPGRGSSVNGLSDRGSGLGTTSDSLTEGEAAITSTGVTSSIARCSTVGVTAGL